MARIAGGAERLRALGFVAIPLGGDVAGLQIDVDLQEAGRLQQPLQLVDVDLQAGDVAAEWDGDKAERAQSLGAAGDPRRDEGALIDAVAEARRRQILVGHQPHARRNPRLRTGASGRKDEQHGDEEGAQTDASIWYQTAVRAVVQRVSRAEVRVDGVVTGRIGRGLVVLLAAAADDGDDDVGYTVDKIVNLRVFADADGNMNLALGEVGGALLIVSQFTLYGDCRKGRRPSFIAAMAPAPAEALYEKFVAAARASGAPVETGRFRAMMDVELVNDGPVTLLVDSKKVF